MIIKSCLASYLDSEKQKYQKYERLRYPETYWSTQINDAEKILERFGNISIDIKGEKALEIRLGNNRNTVIIMPVRGGELSKSFSDSDIPSTHKVQWNENSLTIKPKKKFKKEFPQTLIIRKFFLGETRC